MRGFWRNMKGIVVGVSVMILGILCGLTAAVCPNGCECNDESLHVKCVNANLDIVPITLNPSITRLNLQHNKIRAVDTGFHFYHQLVRIDLSHNHLIRIAPGSFGQQAKLFELYLNSNAISQISNSTFGTGLGALAVLNLRDNSIEQIEPGAFSHAPSLKELDLGENKLRVLNTSFFIGLTNLHTLRINKNELTQVPEIFSGKSGGGGGSGFGSGNGGFGGGGGGSSGNVYLPHLTELFMGTNQIEIVKADAFAGAKNLATLDLRGNHIKSIEQFAFRGLGLLRKLVLADNELMTVPTAAFAPLAQLESLKMGKNPLGKFDKNAFQGLRNLKTLEMQGAPELVEIDKEAFGSNLNLEHFEVSKGSKLTYLPSKLFHQQSMQKLILKDNSLTTIPEDLVNWRSLRSLEVEGNPFKCVCDLMWLRDLLLEKFKEESTFVLCSAPEQLEEKKLVSVSNKDLNCYLNGPVEKTILGISVSLAIILLIVFFFLMYKYHDRIKNTCKRGFRRPARKNRNTVISSGKDHRGGGGAMMDTATKTSFLSQTQYPYSDEEFAIRASLMSASPPQSASFLQHHNNHHHHPQQHHTLNHPHGFSGGHNSLRHGSTLPHHHHLQQQQHQQQHSNNYGPPNYNEYDTPHVNLNMNYPHFPSLHSSSGPDHLQLHFPHLPQHPPPQTPLVKPIPITEL